MFMKSAPEDRVGPPVRPVDVRLEQRDGERVRQVLVAPEDLPVVLALVGGRVDRVRPVADSINLLDH
jgi:hypothetical protein